MKLFHATIRDLPLGATITSTYVGEVSREAVEMLEAAKPSGKPSRTRGVFAAENAIAAAAYLAGERSAEGLTHRMFEVEMSESHRAPMALVAELQRRIRKAKPTLAVIEEYWHPTRDWVFYEHFGPSFTVLAEIAMPPFVDVYRFSHRIYPGDGAQAGHL